MKRRHSVSQSVISRRGGQINFKRVTQTRSQNATTNSALDFLPLIDRRVSRVQSISPVVIGAQWVFSKISEGRLDFGQQPAELARAAIEWADAKSIKRPKKAGRGALAHTASIRNGRRQNPNWSAATGEPSDSHTRYGGASAHFCRRLHQWRWQLCDTLQIFCWLLLS